MAEFKESEHPRDKDGIKSLENVRELHKYKIAHPWEFCADWDKMPKIEQEGRLWTWQKEINNHTKGINDRLEELKKRGENDDKKIR